MTWKWINKELGLIEVQPTQSIEIVWEMQLSQEGIDWLNTPGCTCGIVPIAELHQVIISGQDDCPVHGFASD